MRARVSLLRSIVFTSCLAFLLGCAQLAAEEPSGPAAVRALARPPISSSDRDGLRRAVIGNTLSGQNRGGAYHIYLAEDGNAYWRDRAAHLAGRWRIDSSGKICARFVFETPEQESCYEPAVDGSSDYVLKGDQPSDRVRILAGNPERL
jgi:hypothetical protein